KQYVTGQGHDGSRDEAGDPPRQSQGVLPVLVPHVSEIVCLPRVRVVDDFVTDVAQHLERYLFREMVEMSTRRPEVAQLAQQDRSYRNVERNVDDLVLGLGPEVAQKGEVVLHVLKHIHEQEQIEVRIFLFSDIRPAPSAQWSASSAAFARDLDGLPREPYSKTETKAVAIHRRAVSRCCNAAERLDVKGAWRTRAARILTLRGAVRLRRSLLAFR